MPVVSLVLLVAWVVTVAGARGVISYRQTGTIPLTARDPAGSPQWWSKVVSTVGFVLLIAAPMADLAGFPRIALLDHAGLQLAGVGLVVLGTAVTLVSQMAMGASWRGDVDRELRTELITDGPLRWVRNPIFSGTLTAEVGFALLVPNLLAMLMLVSVVVALEIQVRRVEEPYCSRRTATPIDVRRPDRALPAGRRSAPRRWLAAIHGNPAQGQRGCASARFLCLLHPDVHDSWVVTSRVFSRARYFGRSTPTWSLNDLSLSIFVASKRASEASRTERAGGAARERACRASPRGEAPRVRR